MKKALLIVDVQNDFCPGGALAVKDGDKVIEPLNRMTAYALKNDWEIFVSRDWHPADTKHFEKWPVHCVQNTHGAMLRQDLKLHGRMYIVTKGTSKNDDGYSPFEGTIYGRPLDEYLREFKIKDLYIGGLATDYCVKAAALDAVRNGYKTYLLLDACRAVNLNPDDGQKAIQEMSNAGVILIHTDGGYFSNQLQVSP